MSTNDCRCKVCEYARRQAEIDAENKRFMQHVAEMALPCLQPVMEQALFQALRDAGIE